MATREVMTMSIAPANTPRMRNIRKLEEVVFISRRLGWLLKVDELPPLSPPTPPSDSLVAAAR